MDFHDGEQPMIWKDRQECRGLNHQAGAAGGCGRRRSQTLEQRRRTARPHPTASSVSIPPHDVTLPPRQHRPCDPLPSDYLPTVILLRDTCGSLLDAASGTAEMGS